MIFANYELISHTVMDNITISYIIFGMEP